MDTSTSPLVGPLTPGGRDVPVGGARGCGRCSAAPALSGIATASGSNPQSGDGFRNSVRASLAVAPPPLSGRAPWYDPLNRPLRSHLIPP